MQSAVAPKHHQQAYLVLTKMSTRIQNITTTAPQNQEEKAVAAKKDFCKKLLPVTQPR